MIRYSSALQHQQPLLQNPDLTPSARILEAMARQKENFGYFALRTSVEHAHYFRRHKLNESTKQKFIEMSKLSHVQQNEIERKDQLPFDEFLKHYFSQK